MTDEQNHNCWVGEKVRLRAVETGDADTFYKWAADYDDEADRYCDMMHLPRTRQGMVAMVNGLVRVKPNDDTFRWIIADREGTAVGNINVFEANRRMGQFKYGIAVARPHWGRGYATEAIRIVLRFFFRELRYQKATVFIYSFNQASIALHEKIGFQPEGRLRRMYYTNGEYFDDLAYGMTAEEFDAIDPKPAL